MQLAANALASERNGRVVFSGLSFSIAAGQLAELRGPNGSGKSTLLRLLAGLVPLAGGNIDLTPRREDSLAQFCHYVGHLDALKAALTVRENLSFWARLLGGGNVEEALRVFKLESLADDPVQLLSAGQRKRLALARLIAASRPIWLLDEPMTALDASSQQAVTAMIVTHLSGGGIVIAATHGDWPLKTDHVIKLGTPS